MQWAICLVESEFKCMALSAAETQYTPHHNGTKHSYSNALSLLVIRCMKGSLSKTCSLWQDLQYWVQLLCTDVSGIWHCMIHWFWIQFHISLSLSIVWLKANSCQKWIYVFWTIQSSHALHSVYVPYSSLGNTGNDSWQKTHRSCQKNKSPPLYDAVFLIYNNAKFKFLYSSDHKT